MVYPCAVNFVTRALPNDLLTFSIDSMRIQADSRSSGYPLVVPATLRTVVGSRGDAGTTASHSRAPLAAYVAQQPVDVLQGFSARAQRAIAAYTQNDVFEQRTQYAQLLGVDVYA